MAGIFNDIKEKVLRYVDTNIAIVKLNAIGKASRIMSYVMFAMVFMLIAFCICLFTGFGLTEAIYDAGVSHAVAYSITTGVYIIALYVVYLMRRRIAKMFADAFVDILTEDDAEDIDNDTNQTTNAK